MKVSQDLVSLLNQLRHATRPRDRLRLLALGYRTLRDLHPSDRRRVAREIGIDGAEQLIEQLARRGGVPPARLLEALERVGSFDPDQLGGVVRALLDPGQRPALVERALDGAVDRRADQPMASPVVEPETAEPRLAGSLEAAGHTAVKIAEELREVVADSRSRAGEQPIGEKVASPPHTERGTSSVVGPPPPAPAAAPAVPGSRPRLPGRPARPEIRPRAVPELGRQARPTLEPPIPPRPWAPPEGGTGEPVGGPAATPSLVPLVRRLRQLATRTEGLADAGLDQVHGLLDEYPSGWARRRALETLLRAGIPRRIDDALALVERLGTAGDRMWALTTLVATRNLEEDERERLVAAAGGSSFARRLRGRLGRARPLTARG